MTNTTFIEKHNKKLLKVVCISDTHNKHRKINIPNGDILIHAGDFTKFGKLKDVQDFNIWLKELKFKHKIIVAGNHECSNLKFPREIQSIITNATFIWQQEIIVENLKIFGTSFFWPFKEDNKNPYYDQIPINTNILVTHGPPKGIVDGNLGCPVLMNKIKELKDLKLVVCGHIHKAHAIEFKDGIIFVNASICKEDYNIGWEPIVVDLIDDIF